MSRLPWIFVRVGVLGILGCSDAAVPFVPPAEEPPLPSQPDPEPATGPPVIAFVSTRTGSSQIHVAAADGTGVTRLTAGESPAWSWDGRQIAFHRGDGVTGPRGIYRIYVDGTGETFIAPGSLPVWSPDGRITFTSGGASGEDGGIFRIDPGVGEQELLVSNEWAESENYPPVWTGYEHYDFHRAQITLPGWSPDGRSLAFHWSVPYASNSRLYILGAEGGPPRRMWSVFPWGRVAWSPEGDRIAFPGTPLGPTIDIYDPASGRREAMLPLSGAGIGGPDWSPDGREIVFHRRADSSSPRRIFIASLDTNVSEQLIPDVVAPLNPNYEDHSAVWSRAIP